METHPRTESSVAENSSDGRVVVRDSTVRDVLRENRLALALASVGLVVLCWPVVVGLVGFWEQSAEYSHGFLIPVISAVVLFRARNELGSVAAGRSILGLGGFVCALTLFFAGHYYAVNAAERLGAWGMLVGAVWFCLGFGVLRAKPFPFLFLLLCIPLPFFILSPLRLALQGFATELSAEILLLLDYSALPEGNVLTIGEHRLEVADACSGIRSLMAITTTAILLAYVLRSGFWKGLLLTVTAVPVTIAVNILRLILVTVALVSFQVDLTRGIEHDLVGLGVFVLSLALLWGLWRFYEWVWPPRTAEVTA